MPVPSTIDDLSQTPSSNSPQGSETVGTQANEYVQTAYAFIRQNYDNTVQKGTGVGQAANVVKIGWSTVNSRLKATYDTTDLGNFVFDSQLNTGLATKQASGNYVVGQNGLVGLAWDGQAAHLTINGGDTGNVFTTGNINSTLIGFLGTAVASINRNQGVGAVTLTNGSVPAGGAWTSIGSVGGVATLWVRTA